MRSHPATKVSVRAEASQPEARQLERASTMKSKNFISIVAMCAALVAATAQAEAKSSTTKKLLIGGAAGVAVGAAGALLINKMNNKGKEASDTTGSLRSSRSRDDDEDETPVRRRSPRGVDQSSTGSVYRASSNESCSVKKVDLFDKRGNYVKAERMRVCN